MQRLADSMAPAQAPRHLGVLIGAGALLLGGCQTVIPAAPPRSVNTGAVQPAGPGDAILPEGQRHRVAMLLPLTGPDAAVGQSLLNAATLALADTGAGTIRITPYDTAAGPEAAARAALADGNRLILGPLFGDNVVSVAGLAAAARVPVISFSNDIGVAGPNVFLMGQLPDQSIARVADHAIAGGKTRLAALVPTTVYGQRAASGLTVAARERGAVLVGVAEYGRSAASVAAAVRRLDAAGPYDAVLIADSGRAAITVVPAVRRGNSGMAQILGTELWNTESALAGSRAMRGAWFASVPDTLYRQFADKYRSRFGTLPYRIASLGYDAILLTVRIARDWPLGTGFPTARITDPGGFIGIDGAFRFRTDGTAQRAMEVQEVRSGSFAVIDPAPAGF